jgi:hypothetical protein
VADRDSIFKFTPSGVKSIFPSEFSPEAMAFDKAGNLFVASPHSILKFAPDAVYFRSGDTFREIVLPEAKIPDRLYKPGKSGAINSANAVRWEKNGSLVVEIESMVDGNEGSVTATRTVVLGFDRSGKARILKSTIKYETEKE